MGALVAVRFALGLFLPVGLALAAFACQAVAYGVSRRYRHGAALPDTVAPARAGRVHGAETPVGRPPAGQDGDGRASEPPNPSDQALAEAPNPSDPALAEAPNPSDPALAEPPNPSDPALAEPPNPSDPALAEAPNPSDPALAEAPTSGPGPAPAARPVAYVPTRQDRPDARVPAQAGPVADALTPFPHRPLLPGEPQTIGGYQLLGRIGSGGMGTVYLARREGAATQVALKTINPELLDNADLLRRFQRESEVLSMVSGAYTARVLDSGVDAVRPYLAMELLDGRPLDVHLAEQGPIRAPEALRALALALAVALSGVHRLGLVHRDLKPANIMLTTAGPRLLDFGIADLVDGTRLTRTGAGPGTLTYMAPEQFGEERVGPAADVWAWACCVVCAAHGTSPFSATSTGAVIRRIVDTGPEPSALAAVRGLDPDLAAAVERALAVDPVGRPADGAGLVELLTSPAEARHEPTLVDVREEITRGWRTLAL
ncbi:protein kinase [Streptomyces sp. NPDC047971]|uniref:serine/threonine-protein kinase n=1 Tax=Streptomyces sp. NPDC047971 TaxID=3154499 RepID=UPI0033D600C9